MYNPDINMWMLDSMDQAILVQQDLIKQDPNNLRLQTQLSRLQLEREGFERVARLFQSSQNNKAVVVWISPPGMGLDSGESRINFFAGQRNGQTWQIDNAVMVAAPSLTALSKFYLASGGHMPDDAGWSVGSFLRFPFVSHRPIDSLIDLVGSVNRETGYRPPGFGVDLHKLIEFSNQFKTALYQAGNIKDWIEWFGQQNLPIDLGAALTDLINQFHHQFYQNSSLPTQEQEIWFLKRLLNQMVKPWLKIYFKLKTKTPYDPNEFDAYWSYLTSRTSGCGLGLASNNQWSLFGLSFGPPHFIGSKQKKEEDEDDDKATGQC